MLAYLNDPKVRKLYLSRVKAHEEADEIVQGKYWEEGKGCAVGCTIHGADHSKFETELGIPAELAYLQDALFEALPAVEAKTFPAEFLGAIKTGADLSRVWDKFHVWLLIDSKDGVVNCADREDVKGWLKSVAVLFERSAAGVQPTQAEKDEACRAARACRAASVAAASSASAGSAAWAAWTSRSSSAAWAARVAWGFSYITQVRKQRAKLIELLKEAA